jgi:hypothetical protein
VEFESLFTSTIEVGIGIAGFAGIVAVLGHRSTGEWTRADRGRMAILLQTSFATVLLSFFPLLVSGTVADRGVLWSICSGAYAAYTVLSVVIRIPRVRELRKDPANEIDDAYLYLVSSAVAISVVLQLANIVWLRTGWPYAAGVLWTMTLSFTMFVRLMRVLWRSRAN